jgi:hypothetical protein
MAEEKETTRNVMASRDMHGSGFRNLNRTETETFKIKPNRTEKKPSFKIASETI